MSYDLLPTEPEPPDEGEDGSRRHALIGLGTLGGIAGLVVLIAVVVSSVSSNGHGSPKGGSPLTLFEKRTSPAEQTTPTPTPTPAPPTSTHPATHSPSPTTSAHPTPATTGNPCPSIRPCAVTGDAGAAVAAVNQFRAHHGASPVPGTISPQAQQCALQQGEGAACEPHYAWQAVSTQDGRQVINKIAGLGGGLAWLLDPRMRSFSIGWAYVPNAAGGPGLYECAILKITA